MSLSATRRLPPDPSHAPRVVGVVQTCEHVLVAGILRCLLGKSLGQPEPPLAQVCLQTQAAADLLELLAPGVGAGDGGHGHKRSLLVSCSVSVVVIQ